MQDEKYEKICPIEIFENVKPELSRKDLRHQTTVLNSISNLKQDNKTNPQLNMKELKT